MTDQSSMLDTVEEAIEAIGRGEIVVVVDDEDRENEGDFVCAAEKISPRRTTWDISYII